MPTVKKISTAQPKVFFRLASKYLDFLFVATPSLHEIKGHSLTASIFCNGSFRKVSSIRKKLFSTISVNFLFSNANFREFKSQSFRTKDCRKHFSVESFKRVSVLRKKIFSTA